LIDQSACERRGIIIIIITTTTTTTTMIMMNNVENDVPLLEEPIVAVVRMADDDAKHFASSVRTHSIEAPHVMALSSSSSSTLSSFDSEEAIRRLTQFIIGSATTAGCRKTDDRPHAEDPSITSRRRTEPQHHDADPRVVVDEEAEPVAEPEDDPHDDNTCSSTSCLFAEQLPELFLPLYNAITMLQSHANLAHQEAAMAVQDADTARRQAQLWKHRAVRLSQERTVWQEDHLQLQARNQQLSQQRTMLKRAYKQLWQEQVSQSARSVETALLLHEDHLRGGMVNITNNSCTEGTSDTEVSFDEEEEESVFKEVKSCSDDERMLARSAATTSSPLSSSTPHSPHSNSSMSGSASVIDNNGNNNDNYYYKPLQLQVTSGSLQKQLLQKHRLPRAKIAADDLAAATAASSPTSVAVVVREGGIIKNDAVPTSIVYQS
jgi:hypothetical protein